MVSSWLADVNHCRRKMPGLALSMGHRLSVPGKISPGEDRDNFVAPFLDVCAATFFSVHQHDDESDLSAGFFDRIYRLDGGTACRDDVVNYHHRSPDEKLPSIRFCRPCSFAVLRTV